jgi:hypothetical protein
MAIASAYALAFEANKQPQGCFFVASQCHISRPTNQSINPAIEIAIALL